MRFMLLLDALLVAVLLLSSADGQTVEDMQTHVEYLASDDLGGRAPGSDGMDKAAAYVQAEFEKLGMTAYRQEVRVRGVTCQNTIFVLPGRTEDRIVVGAHLDHLGTARGRGDKIYNGADDNASGCAMVIETAKQLAKTTPACTIEFHFYTGEEAGLIGSAAYVKTPLADIEQYRLMLCLDMVGRLQHNGLIGIGGFPFEDVLGDLFEKYPFASDITWAKDTEDSDHSSWWKAGVPAVILHTGLHDEYHRPDDEADKINYPGMVSVCEYAVDIMKSIDRELHPPTVIITPYVFH